VIPAPPNFRMEWDRIFIVFSPTIVRLIITAELLQRASLLDRYPYYLNSFQIILLSQMLET
jgi:hypothetical protein